MDNTSAKLITTKAQIEQMLYNAVIITEMAMDLKDKSAEGEKYVCYLRSLVTRASRAITAMENSSKSFLLLGQRLVISAIKELDRLSNADTSSVNLKIQFEKLQGVLEKELAVLEDSESLEHLLVKDVNMTSISEKIKYLEAKQCLSEHSFSSPSSSPKIYKQDFDEKYPESCSKDSLLDLNNVMNLPPVPEDIFTSFSKPVRTSSVSSLKSIRKVKLYLQRAALSEDEEDSDTEEQLILPEDGQRSNSPEKKNLLLGRITEEV